MSMLFPDELKKFFPAEPLLALARQMGAPLANCLSATARV